MASIFSNFSMLAVFLALYGCNALRVNEDQVTDTLDYDGELDSNDDETAENVQSSLSFNVQAGTKSNETNPTTPTPITVLNRGRCFPDARLNPNTKGYTWWIGSDQRCTSVYIPPSAPKPMPVVFEMSCYTSDTTAAKAFGRFPVAKFLLSTSYTDSRGKGAWRMGNDGVVNDQNPQPCSDENPEILYVKAIFQLVETDPATYDASKIYTYGFSQNSMFSAYVGFCFSHKVAGIVQAGVGMVVTADNVKVPNRGGLCKYSDYLELGAKDCYKDRPCTECQYWPIYPCYEPRPVVYCGFVHQGDTLAMPTQKAMYDRAVIEGFDSRYVEWPGGKHKHADNKEEWYAGCMGMTEECSAQCVTEFKACAEGSDYKKCLNSFPSSCSPGCSPTLDMLVLSEKPAIMELSRKTFGSSSGKDNRGTSSKCEHDPAGSPPAPAPRPRPESPVNGVPSTSSAPSAGGGQKGGKGRMGKGRN